MKGSSIMLECLACIMVSTTANIQDLTVTLILYCTNVSCCLSEKEVNALLDELLKDVSMLQWQIL